MTASLNEKLRTVKWGKYKTSELFQPQKITNMLSKEDLSEKFNFPAYSSESTNNGIIGYTDSPEFICDDEHPVFVTFGDHTCSFNIATKSFSVLDNVKVLLPSIHNIRCLLWIITAWQKQIPNLGYARHLCSSLSHIKFPKSRIELLCTQSRSNCIEQCNFYSF